MRGSDLQKQSNHNNKKKGVRNSPLRPSSPIRNPSPKLTEPNKKAPTDQNKKAAGISTDWGVESGWVLNAESVDGGGVAFFSPIDGAGRVIMGMGIMAYRSPGKLVGVFHLGGQEMVEEWIKRNPGWRKEWG